MTKKLERVVVTGMGVASPLGSSVDEFWNGLVEGRPGVGSLDGTNPVSLTSVLASDRY